MAIPDFILFGVPKAASTTLHATLAQHPAIRFARVKEPNYFTYKHEKGWEWYRSLFDEPAPGQLLGEASINYLRDDQAPARVAAVAPNAKLIAVLRDPVERARSEYWFRIHDGRINPWIPFAQAIRQEPSRAWLVDSGMYADHLDRWERHFDRSQILLLLHEDIVADAGAVARRACEFLGIDPSFPFDTTRRDNVTKYPRSMAAWSLFARVWLPAVGAIHRSPRLLPLWERWHGPFNAVRSAVFFTGAGKAPPLGDAEARQLGEAFRDSNRRVAERLGRDLSHWSGMKHGA